MQQKIYLLAWDVSAPTRLRRVSMRVKAWKACGQKSLAECWLSAGQRQSLLKQLEAEIDPDADRLCALRLDPRQNVMLFGIAARPANSHFVIV